MSRILIVDDNALKRDALSMVVTAEGHTPLTARDGVEGLHMAQTEKPDLIVADLIMPIMDGYDLCQALKHDPDLAHIPVVMNSVMDDAKVQALMSDCDVRYFIPMAAKRKDIMDIVNAALEGRPNSLAISVAAIVVGLEEARAELKALSKKLSSS